MPLPATRRRGARLRTVKFPHGSKRTQQLECRAGHSLRLILWRRAPAATGLCVGGSCAWADLGSASAASVLCVDGSLSRLPQCVRPPLPLYCRRPRCTFREPTHQSNQDANHSTNQDKARHAYPEHKINHDRAQAVLAAKLAQNADTYAVPVFVSKIERCLLHHGASVDFGPGLQE